MHARKNTYNAFPPSLLLCVVRLLVNLHVQKKTVFSRNGLVVHDVTAAISFPVRPRMALALKLCTHTNNIVHYDERTNNKNTRKKQKMKKSFWEV